MSADTHSPRGRVVGGAHRFRGSPGLSEPLVSVILPVLDEARALPDMLDRLATLPGRFELLVVDAGSQDSTPAIVRRHRSAPRLLTAPRGRAAQMNAGAARAGGDALLFLHADTQLPNGACRSLAAALEDPEVIGGNFTLRFDGDDRFSRLLTRWYALQRHAGIYYGDSAIWVRRDVFWELGGYAELPIMEDYEFVRRMERCGRTACLPGPAITSSRRWTSWGVARTVAWWVTIRWLFLARVPPARLAKLYPPVR